MNIGEMDSSQRDMAIEVLTSTEYEEVIVPIIKQKIRLVTEALCNEDYGDERNRGLRLGLLWVLSLEAKIKEEIYNKRNVRKQEIKSQV